ncbi:hypothetical protein KUTeg_003758, partial [Tegillarca granosa]
MVHKILELYCKLNSTEYHKVSNPLFNNTIVYNLQVLVSYYILHCLYLTNNINDMSKTSATFEKRFFFLVKQLNEMDKLEN